MEKSMNFHQYNGNWGVNLGTKPGMPQDRYADNFLGIRTDYNVVSIKTIITVEPEIIGTPSGTFTVNGTNYTYDSQGLAEDPYVFIKIEGRLNE